MPCWYLSQRAFVTVSGTVQGRTEPPIERENPETGRHAMAPRERSQLAAMSPRALKHGLSFSFFERMKHGLSRVTCVTAIVFISFPLRMGKRSTGKRETLCTSLLRCVARCSWYAELRILSVASHAMGWDVRPAWGVTLPRTYCFAFIYDFFNLRRRARSSSSSSAWHQLLEFNFLELQLHRQTKPKSISLYYLKTI